LYRNVTIQQEAVVYFVIHVMRDRGRFSLSVAASAPGGYDQLASAGIFMRFAIAAAAPGGYDQLASAGIFMRFGYCRCGAGRL
jgi:hypothetical protein